MEAYTPLKDLSPDDEGTGFIKVRITREWEGKKQGSETVMNKTYIIVDEKGTQIQAGPLQFGLIEEYKKKLKLGSVYMISKFTVESAPNTHRPVPGETIVKFHRKTVVREVDDAADIPMIKFELKKFQEARARLGEVVTLMDVVGKLIEFTHIKTTPTSGRKSLNIVLADDRNDTIKITLWEHQAYNFLKLENEYKKPDVFVIVTGVCTKSVNGEIVLWSSSSTQYFFNIEDSALMRLRENPKMKDNKIPTIAPVINNPMQKDSSNIDIVTIDQLFDAQLPVGATHIQFYVEATVAGLIPEYGWYYIACHKCSKKMNEVQECNNCVGETKPIPRYQVTLAVQDSTSDTTFVIFDRHVMKLINVSAQHILNNDQNASPNMIPPVLNNILGKTCMFKLKLTSFNTVKKLEGYTVTEIEEVNTTKSETLKPDADTPKGQLDDELKKSSESPPENKRKLLDFPAENTSIIVSQVAQSDDTTANEDNGDQSTPTSSVVKKKVVKQNNKRQYI